MCISLLFVCLLADPCRLQPSATFVTLATIQCELRAKEMAKALFGYLKLETIWKTSSAFPLRSNTQIMFRTGTCWTKCFAAQCQSIDEVSIFSSWLLTPDEIYREVDMNGWISEFLFGLCHKNLNFFMTPSKNLA